jgi:hypothetical protein
MLNTIWKYILVIIDEQIIHISINHRFLTVAEQNGHLVLWVMIEQGMGFCPATILIRGTGNPLTGREGQHLGTVVMRNGLVWHVFNKITE